MISRRQFTKFLGGFGPPVALADYVSTRWWKKNGNENPTVTSEADTGGVDSTASTTRNGQNEERQHDPTEKGTDGRDKYKQQVVTDINGRSVDGIEIDADSQVDDNGATTVTGIVTNVTDKSLEIVDLKIVFYGADDQYLISQLVTVIDLEAGESEPFKTGLASNGVRGRPERVEIKPDISDYGY